MTQHALILGPSGYDKSDPTVPAQSAILILQSDSTQESVKAESPCLAPRVLTIKEQGFSESVAEPIETPQ